MKVSEMREMRTEELGDKLKELQNQLFALHSQAVTENMENIRAVRNARRDIARAKTIIRERELKGN